MDVPRPSQTRRRRIRIAILAAGSLAGVFVVTVGVARLKPAPPSIERSTVWVDKARRGEMLREVRGLGTVSNGTVTVDVKLEGPLPPGA